MQQQRRNFSRGLRFTLAAVYTLVFTLLLSGVSLLFRQTLASSLDQQAREDLNQSWAAVKGYLRFERQRDEKGKVSYKATWIWDPEDTDENGIVASLKSQIFISDENANIYEAGSLYQGLTAFTPDEIKRIVQKEQTVLLEKRDPKGMPYLLRASFIPDENRQRKFFVIIAHPLAESRSLINRFTWLCVGLVPLVILTGGVMGWLFAGRALTPVLAVAQTAQRISGSNLSLRIKSRGAGDELDYLTDTFNQMIERLEASFNQIRQFSTDVSHELRTPITVVRGQLEVALFQAETVEDYRDAIVNSLSDIERLSQIVRALLLLSQAETGQVILQRQQLDLVELVEDIVDQFQIPAEGADLTLTAKFLVPQCTGEFDKVQIERMLSNLLSNAIKFTPAGGKVEVSVDRIDTQAELLVRDTGLGMAPEHLAHIFDRFYRVQGPSQQASPEKGLGLGLSFVSWIARAHGGSVDVESELGQGTVFRVRLPLIATNPNPIEPGSATGEMVKQA